MSSLARELGAEQDLAAFTETVRGAFGAALGRDVAEACREELEGVSAAAAAS
jgi:hypothetical protein